MLAEEVNIQKSSVDDIHEVNTETTWAGVIIYYLPVKNQQINCGSRMACLSLPFSKKSS